MEIKERVESALESIRPFLIADGGNVELVNITDEKVVEIELKGACKTCNMSMMTLKAGIEDTIKKSVPEIISVIAIQN
jgi:Fe-S cluster biogenesis protein NfuA